MVDVLFPDVDTRYRLVNYGVLSAYQMATIYALRLVDKV